MKRKISRTNELFYFLGMVLCALGVSLSAKSGFGVSMVVAPAYVLHRFVSETLPWFSFGIAEYVFQGSIILLTALICRKVKWKYPVTVLGVLFYGFMVDAWRQAVGTQIPESFALRILFAVLGAVIVALAIAMLLRTYLPQQAYELCVQEIVSRYSVPLSRVKWAYDATSLALAVVLMFVFFGRFDTTMIGPATLVLTLVNAPMINFFGKALERFFDFSSAAPSFYDAYLKKLD